MKIVTFNIKHLVFEDLFGFLKKRFNKIVSFIEKENPDIIGMQEITKKGKKYLEKKLSNYYVIGDSRHSIIFTDEYNPVLIKKEYNLLSYKTYSLSENIDKLGFKTKHDNFPRICVVAHIKKDSQNFCIINTHIDNSSYDNKKRLLDILEKIVKKEKRDDELIILMGDYNMTINNKNLQEFSKSYINPFKNYKESSFPSLPDLKPLDHIFLDKRLDYCNDKIYKDSNDRGFLSDHNPISCEVNVKR